MNKNSKLATSLIVVVICLALAVSPALAAPQPGNGPGEPNRGDTQPARQGWAWVDDEPNPTPVNPPPAGGPAAEKVSAVTTALVVVVFADTNANSVRDNGEVVLEGVYVALESKAGASVRPGIKTDKNGQVSFLNLTAGEYIIKILPEVDFKSASVPVEVLAGETTEVEIGLVPVSTGG